MKKLPLISLFMLSATFACSSSNTLSNASKPSQTAVASESISAKQSAASEILQTGKRISLQQIMSDPDWLGRQPENPGWAVVGQDIVYQRKVKGEQTRELYRLSADQLQQPTKVENSEKHLYQATEQASSSNGRWLAWTFGNSLFVRQNEGRPVLIRQGQVYQDLVWTVRDSLLVRVDNQVLRINPETGAQDVVVTWQFADKPKAVEAVKDYIHGEQIKLIEYLGKQRKQKQVAHSAKQRLAKENGAFSPQTLYFKKNHQLVDIKVSPSLNYAVVATQEKKKYRADTDIMPHYIQENGRIATPSVRQRVADATADNHELWLVDLSSMQVSALSYLTLAGYNDDVLAAVKRENAQRNGESYEDNRLPRPITLMTSWDEQQDRIQWQQSGEQVAIILEAWDNKDRWIVTVDLAAKKLVTQHRLSDTAWINYAFNRFGWLNGQNTLYYLSEESGYSQLYIKPMNKDAKALTQGNFVVGRLTASKDGQDIYYTANKTHPGIYDVYRVNTQTAESTQLTDMQGMTDYVLSPDETQLLLTHSKTNQPPELFLQSAETAQHAQQITHTVSEAFKQLPWIEPQIVAIASSHTQQPIYSRVYLPANVQQGEARRAVVFNHGAGYLQNAHKGWSGYFREYMFHNLLAQQGYVVLDMDYRASKGYGRDWRTAIYRHMGKAEVEDLRDGVDWLVANANVDRNRIGTYGGSYGGFLTFMSLFTAPDLFQAGAALRPVSDWAHYNAPYTANILNLPSIDPIAYERSSPIYFAQGLTKPLLINAPMVDNNVFFVDVVRLVQRLIELEKTPLFETAIYPVESHGFTEPSSWLDEYTRIYLLFEQNL